MSLDSILSIVYGPLSIALFKAIEQDDVVEAKRQLELGGASLLNM